MKKDSNKEPQRACDRCGKPSDTCYWFKCDLICEACKDLALEALRKRLDED